MTEHEIKIDEQENKFYTLVEGKECLIKFRIVDADTLEYYSTFVPKELRNAGIAQELAKFALTFAKKNNKKVIPSCSYVQWYIDNHPEFSIVMARS